MPADGYTKMFNRMLNHENIQINLGVDFQTTAEEVSYKRTIYTGPIDEYFNFKLGKLPYRSLRFEHEHFIEENFQQVGTVNYPNDHAYTRITEFKHLTGSTGKGTSIVREYPTDQGDPYYPIPRKDNENLFKKYQALALNERNVHFVGRLAEYRYYNMDQVVGAALSATENILTGQ
jgi:UDP-galactopyranose mutase